MGLGSKKIYCGKCKRLVKSRKQRGEDLATILCNRCGATLYTWDGMSWKHVGG